MNELLHEMTYGDIMHPEYQNRSRINFMKIMKNNPQSARYYAGEIGLSIPTFMNFLKGKKMNIKSMQIIDRWLERQ